MSSRKQQWGGVGGGEGEGGGAEGKCPTHFLCNVSVLSAHYEQVLTARVQNPLPGLFSTALTFPCELPG